MTAVALARDVAELEALLEPELAPRLEQLRRLAESQDLSGRPVDLVEPELVVVLDGYEPEHPAHGAPIFRELLERPRALRTLAVLLCDDRDREPSRIDARLTLPARGPARYDVLADGGATREEIAADEVDVGTSEAVARTLTPLRMADGGGDGRRSLGDTIRLVELLGLPSAAHLERPARPRSRRASLRVPIGMGADGEVVELDLK